MNTIKELREQSLPFILADPERTGGATECQPLSVFGNGQGVAKDQIVGGLVGQTVVQNIEVSARVAGASDHEARVYGLIRGLDQSGP